MSHAHRSPSLFSRLLGWQTLVLFLVMGVALAIELHDIHDPRRGELISGQVLLATATAQLVPPPHVPEQAAFAGRTIRQLSAEHDDIGLREEQYSFQIWQADGRLLARSDGLAETHLFAPGSLPVQQRVDAQDWVWVAAWNPGHDIWAVVGHHRNYYQRIGSRILTDVISLFAKTFISLWLALWLATRFGLRPLRGLARRIAQHGEMPLSVWNELAEPAELRPVVRALNDYSTRMAQMREAERCFFAHAAHELRTPLASLGAQAHALAHAEDGDERVRQARLLQQGTERTAAVLDKLLTIARLDADTMRLNIHAFDLTDLLETRIAEQVPRALEQKIDLGLEGPPHQRAHADPALLATVLDNLLDNALRYIPASSRITVSHGQEHGSNWICVHDNGPGIPAEDRQRIFERFERGREACATGSGLGLSIARDIMALHHGTLTLDDGDGIHGCRMCLRWPDAPRPASLDRMTSGE
ncbi:MAG: HAMP domain-containing sensor histidine kinase [Pseudomonadota bacterium]